MAGVEGDDEFKDALAAADPPPSSPKPTASKSKPDTGGGGGLGRRLLASIPLPATLSAAIGRFPSPKPPASNVGLGLLLDAGLVPAAAEPPASDAVSGGNGLHLPPLVALQRQHGEDRVAGRGAGVGEEELGLVPAEERWPTAEGQEKDRVAVGGAGVVEEELGLVPAEERWPTAEGREKEGLAVDGCSTNRNCLPLLGYGEEGERFPGDELAASVAQDQEVVVEQQGATEDCAAVVENDSNYSAVECAGDETKAGKDSNAVEVNETVMNQECAVGILDAAEDGVSVRLQECDDAVVAEQGVDAISVQDQHEVVEQCTGDQLTTITDGNAAQDQEVVEQEGATESYTSLDAVEQCTNDGSKAVNDGNTVEEEERGVEQEGAVGVLDAAKDVAPVELQEDGLVLPEQNDKLVEQSIDGQLRTATDDNAALDHELVGQDGVTEWHPALEAIEQCTDDEPKVVNAGNIVEEEDKGVEQEGAVGILDAAKEGTPEESQEQDHVVAEQNEDDISLHDQHKVVEQSTGDQLRTATDDEFENAAQDQEDVELGGDLVVVEQGEDGISVQDQHKVVEQCTSGQLRTTMDNAAEGQRVVEQEGAIVDSCATTYNTVVGDQEKEMKQSDCDEPRASGDENSVEVKDKVVDQEDVDKHGVIKDVNGMELLGNNAVAVEQGGDGIEGNRVELYTSDQLRATLDDHGAKNQKVVEQEGDIIKRVVTTDGIAVEDQEKEVQQSAGDESKSTKDENGVEDNEKVDPEDVNRQGVVSDDSGVEAQEEDVLVAEQGGDAIFAQDDVNVLEQCTNDQLRTNIKDNAAEFLEQEGAIPEKGVPSGVITVEDQDKQVEQSSGDESRVTDGENAVKDNKKVDREDTIDGQVTAKDGSGMESQEENVVVPDQGMDGISLLNEGNVVAQCTSVQLITAADNNAAVDPEPVEQEGVISMLVAAKTGIAAESREDIVVAEQVEDSVLVQDKDEAVEQHTSDQLRTITDDNAMEDQELRREKIGLSTGYPQRPGKLNCRFYLSTGSCAYGSSCHLNHPRLKAKVEGSSFPSEQRNLEVEFLELNRVGLPIRERARKCTYYMRNGTCKYGKKCCYNHPEQVLDVQLHTPTGWDDTNLQSLPLSKKSPEHETMDDISHESEILPPNILRMLLPPQNVPPCTEENEVRVKKDPDWASASDNSDGCCSADSSDGPLCKQEHGDYPERPECPFLRRFGNCKFASSCQYYHPKDKFPSIYHPEDKFPNRYHPKEKSSGYHPKKDPPLSGELMVYPDKPGEPGCPFYVKTGFCKFGANCKFQHPKDITPTMQGPGSPKSSVAANEHHPAATTTLKDHMYQQQKYPERTGRPDCRYYMQFGRCKFQSACIFNHPKDLVSSVWHPAECPFYMKTGTCQFGSACEFHHPKDRSSSRGGDDGTGYEHDFSTKSQNVLQQQEQAIYPERPGALECSHYMKHGYCKFQMNCKFHHPRDPFSTEIGSRTISVQP